MIQVKVKELLRIIKPSKKTYKGIVEAQKIFLQRKYRRLKKFKDCEISEFSKILVQEHLNQKDLSDFVKKERAIDEIFLNL